MNVNTGGPHLLFFERDQQLAALLTSELQLAGYECHTARTAVEVFDAIARYPIRLVLVNLAQAAAGRREFWVALDAQRRGRGVQVLTFHSMNIAGYGADDPDERSRTADVEVDGMLGIMNLVDIVRSRLQGSTTGSFSRIIASPIINKQSGTAIPGTPGVPTPVTRQVTAPMPTLTNNSPLASLATPASLQQQSSQSVMSTPPTFVQPPLSAPIGTEETASMRPLGARSRPSEEMESLNQPTNSTPTFSDKIRAVIYPGSRNSSPAQETRLASQNIQQVAGAPNNVASAPVSHPTSSPLRSLDAEAHPQDGMTPLDREASAQEQRQQESSEALLQSKQDTQSTSDRIEAPSSAIQQTVPSPVGTDESGLAELSRMAQESHYPVLLQEDIAGSNTSSPSSDQREEQKTLVDATPISTQSLRASPIQDIPIEREPAGQAGIREARMMQPKRTEEMPRPSSDSAQQSSAPEPASSAVPVSLPIAGLAPIAVKAISPMLPSQPLVKAEPEVDRDRAVSSTSQETRHAAVEENGTDHIVVEHTQPGGQQNIRQSSEEDEGTTSEDTLLNIMQSLPPMSSPPPAPTVAVLTGRATRSLGSVLLEGHLVPQHRLEVAQHIQRMLRSVDMNYQLGEILLMFKLLTPDQLLAASLVSYGLITTSQISALGRIRQELHSIGLEYDLESLLILFRILTPEQLREVRASWSG